MSQQHQNPLTLILSPKRRGRGERIPSPLSCKGEGQGEGLPEEKENSPCY